MSSFSPAFAGENTSGADLAAGTPNAAAHARPRTFRFAELALMILAIAISAGGYVLVGLGTEGSVPGNVVEYSIWLAALAVLLHALTWWRAKYADPIVVPVAILLNGLGLAMIFRLDQAKNTDFATNQLIWMTLGVLLACAVVVFLRDHRVLRRWTYTFGLAAILLLLLPLIPGLGVNVNGASIWIRLGPLSFQPGEIAKIFLAIFFAGYLVSYRDQLTLAGPKILGVRLPRLRDTGPIAIAWIASVGILVFQRDLGTSLLFFGLFVAMLYVATNKKSWIFIGMGLFAAGAVAATFLFSHVNQRITGWLNALTEEEFNKSPGGSYQLVQGLFGMAKGGLLGTGFGAGRPAIVPYAESDFIYASLGEEMGMVGLFAILLLYVVLFQRGIKTALMLRDGFGTLLITGVAFTIALQTFIVVGGVTRLIPLTGLTTPFLAAGGSSLVANWIIIGLLLRVSDNARRPAEEFQTGVLTIPSERSRRKPADQDETPGDRTVARGEAGLESRTAGTQGAAQAATPAEVPPGEGSAGPFAAAGSAAGTQGAAGSRSNDAGAHGDRDGTRADDAWDGESTQAYSISDETAGGESAPIDLDTGDEWIFEDGVFRRAGDRAQPDNGQPGPGDQNQQGHSAQGGGQ